MEQELSAQEIAIDKAIALLEMAEGVQKDNDVYGLVDAANAWATIALAITMHNRSVVTAVLSESAMEFVGSPDPDAYAQLAVAVEQYKESR